MNHHPKMLKVETGWISSPHQYFPTDEFLDYRVYDGVPGWWRRLEQLLRMDIYLAFQVKKIANRYDIIWANSEKVAIPLSFLNIQKPMVVILHFPESPLRALLIRFLKLAKRWSGVGVVTKGARHFLESQLGIDPGKIFQYFAVRIDHFRPPEDHRMTGGPILSIGVAKRDYPTLIEALAELPGYQTEIFTTSKYGHRYEGQNFSEVPGWIRFPGRVSDDELINHYQACRFVVVPLQPTAHSGAGATTVLEASASGKAVIATNTNGMNSMVIHGKTGLLVPPRDVGAMRDALKTLYENADLAAEMGRAGRKFVEENYNYGSVFCETTVFLQNLWQSHHQAAD